MEEDYRTSCRNVSHCHTVRTTFTLTIILHLLMKWLLSSKLSQFTLCFKAIKQHAAHFYPMTDTSTNSSFYTSKNYNSWQRTFFVPIFSIAISQSFHSLGAISECLFMISQTPILNDTLWKRIGARATWLFNLMSWLFFHNRPYYYCP